jgi:hypothetical protein
MATKLPTLEKCREGINEICKDMRFSEEELQHRARILFLLSRLNFWDELPVLLDEIRYQKKLSKTQ